MKRPIKILISGLAAIVILGASPFAVRSLVVHLGENSLLELAKEGGFCKSAQCDEGVDYAIAFLETNYGLSPDDIKWCMGVDDLAHRKLIFGNSLKTALTDRMYRSCGDPKNDEPETNLPAE